MKIERLYCDFCGFNGKDPRKHEHRELEVGGVPMNIWTPVYSLPSSLEPKNHLAGLRKFEDYIPFDLDTRVVEDEGETPLLHWGGHIFLKDESYNPTNSFKDRGMAVLVSNTLRSGKKKVAIPSTGNAAISLGHYACRAGLESIVFIPKNTPQSKVNEIEKNSSIVFSEDLIKSFEKFFHFCKTDNSIYNGFPTNNLPYLQGLKTLAYEIFLQMGVPDWIVLPVGSGGNVVAQYWGFNDLVRMGLTDKIPQFVTVQIEGADPITVGNRRKQFDKVVIIDEPTESKAEAIASDTCFNYFKILKILEESRGLAVSVTDFELEEIEHLVSHLEYSSLSVFSALKKISVFIKPDANVVLVGTAGKRLLTPRDVKK